MGPILGRHRNVTPTVPQQSRGRRHGRTPTSGKNYPQTLEVGTNIKVKVNVCFYIAQYPIRCDAQSSLHIKCHNVQRLRYWGLQKEDCA